MSLTFAAPSSVSLAAAWTAFWFKPADPTVLGVIRILAGAVACYMFLAYTLDLQALLGEHAWVDLQTARDAGRLRRDREYPQRAVSD